MIDDKELLRKYRRKIEAIIRSAPYRWKDDARQELQLYLLKLNRIGRGDYQMKYVVAELVAKYRALQKRERCRGITYCPDPIDWDEVQHRARECGYTVSQVGNHTIYEKHV